MNLMSFDIGIKNMAYCILSSRPAELFTIVDWKVINLLETGQDTTIVPSICTCILAKSKKPKMKTKSLSIVEPVRCKSLAKYKKCGHFYCEKHATMNSTYYIPKKAWLPVSLKKLKNDDLLKMCAEHNIELPTDQTKILKKTILEKMDAFFLEKCYEPIIAKKEKTSGETDLITIGRNIKVEMDKIQGLDLITHVIMENQISPIANRMKTIQGMLAQYFIMKFDRPIHIEFVSSVNKLKFLQNKTMPSTILRSTLLPSTLLEHESLPQNTVISTSITNEILTNILTSSTVTPSVKSTYKDHKKDAVFYSGEILGQNEGLKSWKESLLTKKKDDLADCFLQGLWYMNNKELVKVDERYNLTQFK